MKQDELRQLKASGMKVGHFYMEINPDVEEVVGGIIDRLERGHFEGSMDTLLKMLPEHPRHFDIPYAIGLIHCQQGSFEESAQWLDRAIAIYPNSLEANYNRAVTAMKLYDIATYAQCLKKVMAHGKADDLIVKKAHEMLDDLAQVIAKNYGICLADYLLAHMRFNAAFALMEKGDMRGALKGFRASIALNEINAPTHGNIGICLGMLGRKAEALAAFDRALEIDPEYELALGNRKLFEKITEGEIPDEPTMKSVNFAELQLQKLKK